MPSTLKPLNRAKWLYYPLISCKDETALLSFSFRWLKKTKTWVLVQCSEHWKGNALTGPISFSIRLTKKDKGAYDELVETIFQRTGVSRDQIQLKLTSHVETGVDKVTLYVHWNCGIINQLHVKSSIIQSHLWKAAPFSSSHRVIYDLVEWLLQLYIPFDLR